MSNLNNSIDQVCGCLYVMPVEQNHIHKGCLFESSGILPSLAYGEKSISRIVTPLENYIHFMNLSLASEGGTLSIKLIEDVTILTPGTLAIPTPYKNLNRNSTNTIETLIYRSPTYSGGTTLRTFPIHGSTTNQAVSNGSFVESANTSIVLKNGQTDYILEVENIDQDEDTAYNIGLVNIICESAVGLVE